MSGGNLSKKKGDYLGTLKAATKSPLHPRNMGIHMQAHHLISEDSTTYLSVKTQKAIIAKGWDINNIKNLSFIPSTLPGACHLSCQLHRGDHTAKDDDAGHPENYHMMVASLIKAIAGALEKCRESEAKNRRYVSTCLTAINFTVASQINSGMLWLTSVHDSFGVDNPKGCGGVTSVSVHEGSGNCHLNRDHYGETYKSHRVTQKIKRKKQASPWKIRPGK